MKVGVIGLGSMGIGAALRLQGAGHEVHGCDTRPGAGAELLAAGGAGVVAAGAVAPEVSRRVGSSCAARPWRPKPPAALVPA